MSAGDDRRSRLLRAKLSAVVRENWAIEALDNAAGFPNGAALELDDRAWVLDEDLDIRSAGGPLVWAARHAASTLDVIFEVPDAVGIPEVPGSDIAGDVARRLGYFAPAPRAWRLAGISVQPVEPTGVPAVLAVPSGAETLIGVLQAAGLEVVVEHGIIRGDYLGLEVARVVDDPHSGMRLEVGVGQFDRAAAAMMYADLPTVEALAKVIAEVRRHRFAGAPRHPVRDMCRERWLRCAVVDDPSIVGAEHLAPAENTVDRPNLRDPFPAIAVGAGKEGPIVVAATVGVDVDLLPMAADARALHAPEAELVLVAPTPLPEVFRSVAERLAGEVRFVEVAAPWAVAATGRG